MLTPLFGGFDSSWTAYPPLSVINANGQLLFLLAFATFGLSSILGGLNFITTIITLRAPNMTWERLPIFVWSIFSATLLSLIFTQVVFFGLLAVILDHVVGTGFFMTEQGGNALLYEHIFWFYSHSTVYIMILPAFGIELEILSHFSRKPVFVYNMVTSWKRSPVSPANPWGARTLEWETTSPPPLENFESPPVVVGDPYGYGEPGARHIGSQPLGAEGDGN